MTGTISLITDAANQRIGVQLSAWVSPANGTLKVFRVHPDTSEWEVRSASPNGVWATSGGAAFAWDYEAPFMQSVTYYAFDGSTKVISSATNLNLRTCWLSAPGLPASEALLTLTKVPRSASRERPSVTLRPLGRETAVVISDVLKARQFEVSVLTKSFAESNALEAVFESSGTLLLQMPPTRWAWQYVTVDKLVEEPVSEKLAFNPASSETATWASWKFTCTVADRPVGGIYGDPTASYQLVKNTYATYQALKTAKATYLDVLKGN